MTTETSDSRFPCYAPELPEEIQLEALLDPAAWINVPRILRFRVRKSDNFFITGNLQAMAAHRGAMLCFYAECDRGDDVYPEMQEHYEDWQVDNALEVFLSTGEHIQQFFLNARGACCCFVDKIQQPCPEGVRILGRREPGKWTLVLAVSLSIFESRTLSFNIRFHLPNTFTQYCEMNNGPEELPMVPLRLVPALTPAQCREREQTFNTSYLEFLRHPTDFPPVSRFMHLAECCTLDFGKLRELCAEFCMQDRTPEQRERDFYNLRREYAVFQRKLLPESRTGSGFKQGNPCVDFSVPNGTIRALNGTNLGPKIHGQTMNDFRGRFQALRFSFMRTHDAPLDNPGIRLGDISLIFANFHDDPADPRNYFFAPTDDYLRNTLAQGTDIVYRLGVSIEHSLRKYAAVAPEDYAKFAEICAGVVRHYNHGWADGFHLNIKYWEIWNEPDCVPQMWNRSMEDYYEMYAVVAKRLKSEFPDIRIGGLVTTHLSLDTLVPFLERCIREQAPVDFLSWHKYGSVWRDFIAEPFSARTVLDAFGFRHTELHLNEWHYFPCSWSALRNNPEAKRYWLTSSEGLQGIDSAAFNTTLLSRWQDTPLTLSNYYATGLQTWGLTDAYGALNRNYYSFLAFGQMLSFPERVEAHGTENVTVLGGRDDAGNAALLVSDFKGRDTRIEVEVKGIPEHFSLRVLLLDNAHDLMETEAVCRDGKIILNKKEPGSAVFLLTFRIEN